ncbi:Granaticin polyketide synthase putative ketoacyl reductase 2 [Neolecta irregularis DAH-3]|uniref:Granaticin polyketide synthase putative ketoacyl reductase 2 n=1 Tax=Neolecta irregularis (strain DAH-3) TaxID=1198029 RepID=A0A1U7LU95_NEOID|nr:Granaticin polyketide synthase putative ketoacyl reductase 2 [Neolecta irregularis DAH-3]|eukprot:OLL26237.1 Granaticin polyketide synthase putative ketoacyl reductase 2 [Neolecta irregularis DAH-3]
MQPLTAKRALITGGSAGLGATIARQFVEKGIKCVINYSSNTPRAEELAKSLGEGNYAVQGDVGTKGGCEALTAVAKLGGLDILVSNVGWTKPAQFNDIYALADEDWDKTWIYNVKAHLWLLQAAKPYLEVNEHGGSFIVTSSVAGVKPSGSSMAYSVTKASANHLVRCLARASAPKIRVNSVSPSMILTDWSARFGEEKLKKHVASNALQKMTDLDDVAALYTMLAANESITGENFNVASTVL